MCQATEDSQTSPLLYQVVFPPSPDYSFSVTKKPAAFMDIMRQLHSCPGVKFGLSVPAVLMITLPSGARHTFEDLAAVMDFVKANY